MLVKTLLCREGRDTGLRLMAIVFAAFALLSMTTIVFPASVIILIFTLMSLPVVGLSAMRRLFDANKTRKLAIVCLLPVLLFGLSAYFMAPFGALAGLFLFGLACGAYLSFLPSKNQIQYVLGYYGPDMVMASVPSAMHRRQDPVMKGQALITPSSTDAPINAFEHVSHDHAEQHNNVVQAVAASHSVVEDGSHNVMTNTNSMHDEPYMHGHVDDEPDGDMFSTNRERSHQPLYVDQDALKSGSITELAKSWINVAKSHQVKLILVGKILAGIAVVCLVIYLVMLVVNTFSNSDDEGESQMTQGVIEPMSMTRQMVKLPDGFWLALEGDVLILRWLGDAGDAQNLWRLASAVGDKTCANLEFNDGSQFRPMTVDLVADGATEARFTPLDKSVMVNHVALRGNFKLCGYEFSLKGSQAALMQNAQFESLLSQ
ncbi:hypothetical protein ACROAE_07750 [Shewanella sp. MF05960]|uniref:hypothetical protein n=1 Tax=Shewanella sp. MF05960 TaxID=3434874 RepID=UPI003D7A769A